MSTLPIGLNEKGLSEENLDAILKAVKTHFEEDVAKMPEGLFSQYFLRALAGLEDDPDKVELFYKGAGGYNKPVDIVDSTGNVICRVPAIASTLQINPLPEDDNAPTFTSIMNAVELLKHRSPIQAQDYLKSFLYKRLISAHKKDYKPKEDELKWIEIFKRYGIYEEVLKLSGQEHNEDKENENEPQDDILIIDEF